MSLVANLEKMSLLSVFDRGGRIDESAAPDDAEPVEYTGSLAKIGSRLRASEVEGGEFTFLRVPIMI